MKQYVQDQLVDQPWLKEVVLEADDLGWLVEVRVEGPAYREAKHKIPSAVGDVKICTVMYG